jgi:hypothetical protein
MTRILSFGGGVDSTALLAIHLNRNVAAARLGISRDELDRKFPPVDAVTFADVGSEFPSTYTNVEYAKGRCEAQGLRFEVVKHGTDTLRDQLDRTGTVPLLPGGGHTCSVKYKKTVQHKWAAANFTGTVYWAIGIEANEKSRTFSTGSTERHQSTFPLQELGLDRAACQQLLIDLDWGVPVSKSSCYFCPFFKEWEIENLYRNHPALWAEVKSIEDNYRATSPVKHKAWIDGGRQLRGVSNRAPVGQWKEDSWAKGGRLFGGLKINGKALSIREWEAKFDLTGE